MTPGTVTPGTDYMPALTPIEQHGGYWVKRDDLWRVGGAVGGKARTCWHMAQGATGLITAGSRHSPQVNIVAQVAARLRIPARVHVPAGPATPEVAAAVAAGATVVRHRPGHNSVIVARARTDAKARPGWVEIPFGMECEEAVHQTARQVANVPPEISRIVVPVGSGMSLAGILTGLEDHTQLAHIPVLGVQVGADPARRLDRYGTLFWRARCTLVPAGVPYHVSMGGQQGRLGSLRLDPIYEAKCLPHLRPGDLLWVVGIRQTAEEC